MKLPFFNRERYILVQAYTFDRRILDDAPVTLGKETDKKPACPVGRDSSKFLQTMNSCYGNVASLKRSITIPSWSEFRVTAEKDNMGYEFPLDNISRYHYVNHEEYNLPSNMCLTKLIVPWAMCCNKKDVNFVAARHILNNTPMIIPTGLMQLRYNAGAHIFNIVCEGLSYKVNYRLPLLSMYPLSDLPLHLEIHNDLSKFQELIATFGRSRPYFEKAAVKESLQK